MFLLEHPIPRTKARKERWNLAAAGPSDCFLYSQCLRMARLDCEHTGGPAEDKNRTEFSTTVTLHTRFKRLCQFLCAACLLCRKLPLCLSVVLGCVNAVLHNISDSSVASHTECNT